MVRLVVGVLEGNKGKGVVVVRLVDGVAGISDEGVGRSLEEGVIGGEDNAPFGDANIQI